MKEDQDVMKALENVVLFKIDAEKGEGIELKKNYEIKGYPTYLALNAEGEVFARWIGYSKEDFLMTLEASLKDKTSIQEKIARFETYPDFDAAVALGGYNRSMTDYGKAVTYYKAAQELKEDSGRDYLFEIFSNTADGARKDAFTFEEAMKAADAVLASSLAEKSDKYSVARIMTSLAQKKDKMDQVAPYLRAGIDALEGSEDPDDVRGHASLMADFNLYIANKPDEAVNYKKQTMPEGWMEDPAQLNSFSWWCFENSINLQEAEDLSHASVKLAESGKPKAMYLDTLAEICNARGKPFEAIEFMRIAVNEAPDDEYYQKQLERFEKLVAADN